MKARLAIGAALLMCGVLAASGNTATRYHVKLRTASGNVARLAFDFACNDSAANNVSILNLTHDGTEDQIALVGGPIWGDILIGTSPADSSSIEAAVFFSEITLPFAALGTHVDFDLVLSENTPASGRPEDEFSLFFLTRADTLPYPTADPLGTDALFALAITGVPGGDLSVFAPMTFVAPDTLLLDGTLLSVPISPGGSERIQFVGVFPNPATAAVRFDFIVPAPSGMVQLRVFDAAGRLVAEPLHAWQLPGRKSLVWSGRDVHGKATAPGVYMAQLTLGGQSSVRKLILSR